VKTQYTKNLYANILPEETGSETGYYPVGFIELACDEDRLFYYRKVAAFNRLCGVNVDELSPHKVKDLFPLCDTRDVLSGFYVKDDGRVNPYDATMALAKGARQRGVKIREGVSVTGVLRQKTTDSVIPKVSGVVLDDGSTIDANIVVNCAGMWARQLGELSGVTIPNQAAEHYYFLTDAMPEVDPSWPVIEDSSKCVYIRPEGAGLMYGLFEWEGASWNENGIPQDFSFGEIEPDWDRMGPYLEKAMERVPAGLNVGAKQLFCGPESFTPDNSPIVGEAPELRNYFVAAGLNSIGILTGGGIGKILAEWIRDGRPPKNVDITGMNMDRFHKNQANITYRAERVRETLGNTYKIHYPDHQPHSCRGAKRSVLHDRLAGANAYFRDVSGWESPAWYAPQGIQPIVERESFGRENWFPFWAAEHVSCREKVALFDMSFMSKFLVQGTDAGAFLNHLSTANVNGGVNTITYTQWLNELGHMEADLTITKLDEDQFLVVATDTMHNHVYAHMRKHLKPGMHTFITDVTGKYAQLNLQGPNSRALLQSLTSCDMTQFPFRHAAEIDIGLARVLCMRITYVGELGYELFIPQEYALHVYERILEQGTKYELRHAGLRALGSLRLEKGYRDYGHDMDNTDSLLECGLGFTCDFEMDFIGREQVLRQKQCGRLRKRMAHIVCLDPAPLMTHGEVIWRNGERISDVRIASYGHTLGGAVGLTMLEADEPINKTFVQDATWEVEIANNMYACHLSLTPFYDPKNTRIKV
jgi:glycine cleavage system aminomethyltransferase T/glycine/D-amino acid oxidase-like deaminating enzyme